MREINFDGMTIYSPDYPRKIQISEIVYATITYMILFPILAVCLLSL